jgi:hypothetical protein
MRWGWYMDLSFWGAGTRDLNFARKNRISSKFCPFRSGPINDLPDEIYWIWGILHIFFKKIKVWSNFVRKFKFGWPKMGEIPEFRPFHSGPVKNQNRNPNPWLLRVQEKRITSSESELVTQLNQAKRTNKARYVHVVEPGGVWWPGTVFGHTVTAATKCVHERAMPAVRVCVVSVHDLEKVAPCNPRLSCQMQP